MSQKWIPSVPSDAQEGDALVLDASKRPGWGPTENGGFSASEGGVYFLSATAPSLTSTPFSWTFGYATEQLDLSDPQHPAILTAGVYALTVAILSPSVYTAGTKIAPGIDIDSENNDAGVSGGATLSPGMNGGAPNPLPLAITFYTPAGNSLLAQINHDDVTTGSLDFTATAFVQRVA